MEKKIAVLDLGTNTFHLLIAEVKADKKFDAIFKQEEFVNLAEEGIGRIGDAAFARGVEQMKKYKAIIDEHQLEKIIAFATAAIRSASNGDDFIRAITEVCPMEVRKISGDEEAELIYLGVKQAVALDERPVLIMDIGGGSTEFIIANNETISWKQSFPLGASMLRKKFQQHEPLSKEEVHQLIKFLEPELQPLIDQKKKFNITRLVGASGSFDTFALLVANKFFTDDALEGKTSFEISTNHFLQINIQLQTKNLEQRLAMPGMIPFRAGMIVVAAVLAQFVIQQFRIQSITQSAFALKEGVVSKMLMSE